MTYSYTYSFLLLSLSSCTAFCAQNQDTTPPRWSAERTRQNYNGLSNPVLNMYCELFYALCDNREDLAIALVAHHENTISQRRIDWGFKPNGTHTLLQVAQTAGHRKLIDAINPASREAAEKVASEKPKRLTSIIIYE